MTDYKHFPRIPRQQPELNFEKMLFVLMLVFILAALSVAGKEDMQAAQRIDEATVWEKIIQHQPKIDAALYEYYSRRAK